MFNGLDLSHGFRTHVAKHLVRIMDQNLQSRLKDNISIKKHSRQKQTGGIRLFSASSKSIKQFEIQSEPKQSQKSQRRNTQKNLEGEEKDLTSIIVDGKFILSKKDTIHWSQRSKAAVFHYKKKNGVLHNID